LGKRPPLCTGSPVYPVPAVAAPAVPPDWPPAGVDFESLQPDAPSARATIPTNTTTRISTVLEVDEFG
jgi:hypothetical protein